MRLAGQLLAHQAVQQVDRLERTDHHLEMSDEAWVIITGNDVDAIDPDPLNLGYELQHAAFVAAPFTDKLEARAAQHLSCAHQIFERDLTPDLRCVHNLAL